MPKAPTEIKSLARSYTHLALNTLKGIAGKKDAPPAARVAASIALLDRGWGKPDQHHEVGPSDSFIDLMRRVTAGEFSKPVKVIEHEE